MAQQVGGAIGVESAAKTAAESGAIIIGHSAVGKIILDKTGTYALKHPIHRFTKDVSQPWGHPDDGYTQADLVPVHMHLDSQPTEETKKVVGEWLNQMRQGYMPKGATQGVEVEGVTYKKGTATLAPAFVDATKNAHPELMVSTLETATGKDETDSYPYEPVSIAREISYAILGGNEHASLENNTVVYSSVPEGGNIYENSNTPIPYLQAFAPRVLDATINNASNIPQEIIQMYGKMGVDIIPYLNESRVLNWPVQALHVHNGVPMIGDMADPRSAFAMAEIRHTEMAKILSFMLYNTQYCYGVDTEQSDVRSLMRRLLATTHGGEMPKSAEEYLRKGVEDLVDGKIHSLARYPAESQHDRTRIRVDGTTMESIDGAMNPDLRLVLGWTYINQIMNVISLDSLNEVRGDESKVLDHLQKSVGPLMKGIPAMGNESCYEHDLIFNKDGYDGKASWMDKSYADSIQQITSLFDYYAKKYPAIETYVKIANHILTQVTQKNVGGSLEEYFGIEDGIYKPNGKNRGIVTDAKKGLSVQELIKIQSKATRLQAEALSQVHDDVGLLDFFGIN